MSPYADETVATALISSACVRVALLQATRRRRSQSRANDFVSREPSPQFQLAAHARELRKRGGPGNFDACSAKVVDEQVTVRHMLDDAILVRVGRLGIQHTRLGAGPCPLLCLATALHGV